MVTQFKLEQRYINQAVIARASGETQRSIAENLGVSVDTVARIQKESADFLNLFVVDKQSGVATLRPDVSKLFIDGVFLYKNVILTGDVKDGVIYANGLYSSDYAGDTGDEFQHDSVSEWMIEENDLGLIRTVKIGKLVVFTDEDINENSKNYIVEKWTTDTENPENPVGHLYSVEIKKPGPEPIWNASNKFISITIGPKVYNADSSHPNFKEALACLCLEGDTDKAIELIDVQQAVKKYVKGNVVIDSGVLTYKGMEIRSGLTQRILQSMKDNADFEFYLPFLENLMLNPSNSAVMRLYDFLVANDIEITKDGYFIAWKKVNSAMKDIYTGKIDNSVGQVVEMPRNMVDEDDHTTCSHGLHVCSKSYLGHFGNGSGDIVVKVKVHPKDVVAIPVDYKNAKMRVCRYHVESVA